MYAETFGCMYAELGCMYAETFGCMYADVGCKSAETFGCKVCGCWVQVCGYVWVQSMRMLGASLQRRLGAKYAVVGCKFHNG